MARVRVHDSPPNGYQQWLRWLDRHLNAPAGESIRYLTRRQAHEVGLLPEAGDVDWWLFDSCRLVQMHFDSAGNRTRTVLTSDSDAVVQANA